MTAHDWNVLIAIALIGIPMAVVFGVSFAWRGLVILLGLALFVSYPSAGLAVILVYLLRAPIRWFIEGLALGWGARVSGVFRRGRACGTPPIATRSLAGASKVTANGARLGCPGRGGRHLVSEMVVERGPPDLCHRHADRPCSRCAALAPRAFVIGRKAMQ
jgi:hypothetical protein